MTKPGPKPKSEADLRRHHIACRLTDAELAHLVKGKPDKMSRGEWLRTKALKRKLPKAIPELNRQAWAELARLAGNLNQYMRAINQGQAPAHADQPDLGAIYAEVQKLRRELVGLNQEQQDEQEEQ